MGHANTKIGESSVKRATRYCGILVFVVLALIFLALPEKKSEASVYKAFNYQGKLLDNAGWAVPDGNYSIYFLIYDDPSTGSCLWTARGTCGSPIAKTIAVSGGIFSTMLGESGDNALPDFTSDAYYLEVRIDYSGTPQTLSPRKRVGSVPQALNANALVGDGVINLTSGATTTNAAAITVNSLTSGNGLSISSTSLSSGALANLSINSTAATGNTQSGLTISTAGANATSTQTTYGGYITNTHTGTSSTNVGLYVSASGASNNYGLIVGSGNVGIGVTTPSENLEVASNEWVKGIIYQGATKDPVATQTSAAKTIYVNSGTGSDVTGDGTVGNPYATITRALQDVPTVMLHSYTIQLAAGTYREEVNINKTASTLSSAGTAVVLDIKGDPANPNNYRITGADAGADTTAVRNYGIMAQGSMVVKVEGVKIDYTKYAGIEALRCWIQIRNVNLNYTDTQNLAGAIMADKETLLDFRSAGTINITGNGAATADKGIYFVDGTGGWLLADNTVTFNISEVKYGIYAMGGMAGTFGDAAISISNASKVAGTAAIVLSQKDSLHDVIPSVTNFDQGVNVSNGSYLDLDSTAVFTNVNTAVVAEIGADVDVDTTTFSTVTTKYSVSSGSIVDATGEATTGKMINALSGASSVADSGSAVAFSFDTINTLSTAGALLLNVQNSGSTKFSVDKDGLAYLASGLGINTTGPDRKLDVLDSSNPQMRLTYTDGTVYTDFQTTSSGGLTITPSGTASGVNIASANTTGTTTNAALSVSGNSLTSGTGLYAASSSLSSGSLIDVAVTGTAAASNTQKALNISTSGANGTSTQTTYGGYISNTHTGTSSTNVGLYLTASGGTNNYGLVVAAGNVGIGTTTPTALLHLSSSGIDYLKMSGTNAVDFNTNSYSYAVNATQTMSGALTGSNAHTYYGMYFNPTLSGTQNTSGVFNVRGLVSLPTISGTITSVNSASTLQGVQTAPLFSGSGTYPAVIGVRANYQVSGASAVVTNGYSVYIPNASAASGGTITNNYGLYLENQTAGGTLNYSIYSAGGQNYFAGNVGVGVTTPTYQVETAKTVKAGTAMYANSRMLYFDNNDDYVNLGNITEFNSVANYSVSAWVEEDTIPPASGTDYIFKKIVDGNNSVTLYSDSSTGRLYANVANGSNAYVYVSSYSNYMVAGRWHFVTVVYDGTQTGNTNRLKIYIDGVDRTSSSSGTIPATTADLSSTSAYISNTGTGAWNGGIYDLRIYAESLSSTNLATIYQGGAYTTNMVHQYKLMEGTGTTATDTGSNVLNGTITNATWSTTGNVGIRTDFGRGALTLAPNATDAKDGLWFGYDVNLYRSAASTLKADDNFVINSPNTTGTTTSASLSVSGNSITTGTGLYVASSSLSSGALIDVAVTGTAAASNTQKALNISTSGANGTSTQTTYGGYISNTHTGTSSTNIGLYATASGANNNYAAIFDSGNVGIGVTTPISTLEARGATNGLLTLSSASTAVVTGDSVGEIDFYTYDASTITNRVVATIKPIATSDYVGTDSAATALTFWTHGSSAGAETEKMRIDSAGLVGIGTTAPTKNLSFSGQSAQTIWMERETTTNTAGYGLTIQAGGATSGATDKNGGSLTLSSGTATGAGSSTIIFQTAAAGAAGTSDRAPATRLTIDGSGNAQWASAWNYLQIGGGTSGTGGYIQGLAANPPGYGIALDYNALYDSTNLTWTQPRGNLASYLYIINYHQGGAQWLTAAANGVNGAAITPLEYASMKPAGLNFEGTAAKAVSMSRNLTPNSAGSSLTISAGGASFGQVSTISITAGGSGYTVGDVLTLATPTAGTAATVTVTSATGGVVDGVSLTTSGASYTTGTKATTGGTGTGCTINVTAVVSSTDKNGGGLVLSTGISTGTGTSTMSFQTSAPITTGAIKTTTLNAGGSGYTANDVVTVSAGNNDATITINTVDGSGAVLTYTLTTAGTGYAVLDGNSTTYGGAGNGFKVNVTAITGSADNALATRMTITGAGDVGIGTSSPTQKLQISDSNTAANRAGIYVNQTGAISGIGYGGEFLKSGASTTNIGVYTSATGATTNYGVQVGAMTGATNNGFAIVSMSGGTANYGVNIGAISGTGVAYSLISGAMSSTGGIANQINLGAISGANATNHAAIVAGNISGTTPLAYGINLGTLTGGTTSNYQINTGVLTKVASATNAQINLGAVSGDASSSTNYGINIGAISGTGTANYGIYVGSVSGATANYAAIFAAGKVGIANTAPTYDLSLGSGAGDTYFQIWAKSTNTAGILFSNATSVNNGAIFYDNNANSMAFRTNGADNRIFITSAGYVGIGGTGYSKLDVGVNTTGWAYATTDVMSSGLSLVNASNSASAAPYLIARRSDGTLASPTIVASGDQIFSYIAQGYDGSAFREAGRFGFWVDATPGSSDMPGRFSIWTTPDGSATSIERFRIDNNGYVGIGTTAPTNVLSLSGQAAQKIWMERHTTSNTAGNGLSIQAGGATSGATDKNGGDLTLMPGLATGNGSASVILQAITGSQGAGTSDRSPATVLTIAGASANLAAGKTLTFAGASSGVVTIQPAAAAGTYALTLPTSAGSSGQLLRTDGSGVLSWSTAGVTGSDKQVQFNDGGTTMGADAGFTYDKAAHAITLSGYAVIPYIKPSADATTAFQIRKNDGTTVIFNVDSTNSRVGIGTNAPTAMLNLKALSLGDEVFKIETTAGSGDNPNYRVFQNKATTTDATVTTVYSQDLSAAGWSGNAVMIEARVVAKAYGVPGADAAGSYIRKASFVYNGSTMIQQGTTLDDFTAETVAGWDCTIDSSGSTIRVRVTGAGGTNIAWSATVMIQNVSQ